MIEHKVEARDPKSISISEGGVKGYVRKMSIEVRFRTESECEIFKYKNTAD